MCLELVIRHIPFNFQKGKNGIILATKYKREHTNLWVHFQHFLSKPDRRLF